MSSLRSIRLSLGALAAVQLTASFLLQLMILAVVRVGAQTDAYIAAQTVPLLIFAIVGTSVQNAWQPRLVLAAPNFSEWIGVQSAATGQVLIVVGSGVLILAA